MTTKRAGYMSIGRLAILLVSAVAACAQVSPTAGAIRGAVLDPSGAAIPNAHIRLENSLIGVERESTTQADGVFTFPLLPAAAAYILHVSAANFDDQVSAPLAVYVSEFSQITMTLRVAGVTGRADVIERADPVQSVSPTLGTTLDARTLTALPLNSRNTFVLLGTSAGVASLPGSISIYVAGSRATTNTLTLNGVNINNFEFGGLGNEPSPNPESIAEIRTQTSLYDATTGRGAGGNISIISRSGSEQFHGALYEFNRNGALAANTFFLNRAGLPKAFLNRNQFGGSMGGPIRKGSTYFFGNYDGVILRSATTISGLAAVLPESRDASSLAAAFGLPASALDPVAVKFLNLPGPYGGRLVPSGVGTPGRLGSYTLGYSIPQRANQGTGRLDHDWRSGPGNHRTMITALVSYNNVTNLLGGANTGFGTGVIGDNGNHSISLADTWVIAPRWLNDFTAGGVHNRTDVNNGFNAPSLDDIGMHRFNENSLRKIPSLVLSDQLSGWGPPLDPEIYQRSPVTTLRDMVSYIRGRHNLRFGAEMRRYQFNFAENYSQYGRLVFGNTRAGQFFGPPPAGVTNTAMRDFLIGAPLSLDIGSGAPDRAYRSHDYTAFVQDDVRIHRTMTVSLGLRYDLLSNISEKRGRTVNFVPERIMPEAALVGGAGIVSGFVVPESVPGFGTRGVGNTALNGEDRNNFGPRVGFAWDVLGKRNTAVRGGYGLYFVKFTGLTPLQLYSAPPFFVSVSQTVNATRGALANPFPALPLPTAFPVAFTPAQLTGYGSGGEPLFDGPLLNPSAIDPDIRTPYSHHWNVTVQQSLGREWAVEVGYIGTAGRSLLATQLLNSPLLRNANNPAAFGLASNSSVNRDARRPVAGLSDVTFYNNTGASDYHAAIVSVTKRTGSLYFKAAYTFSKSLDNNSLADGSDSGTINGNSFLPALNHGLSDFDIRHRLIISYVYSIPSPRQRHMRAVLGGWRWSGITTLQTGLPFSVFQFVGSDSLQSVAGRAIVAGGCDPYTSGSVKSRLTGYLNASCFSISPRLTSGTSFGPLSPYEGPGDQTYTISSGGAGRLQGNIGRNTLRGPLMSRWDAALAKTVHVPSTPETCTLEIRGEFFQIFNNPIFGNPSATVGLGSFGTVSRLLAPPRQIQLALKLSF